jgi:hypothetical protein
VTTKNNSESPKLVYQVRLSVSTRTLNTVITAIRTSRHRRRSRWRKLSDHQIALVVLGVLRHDQRLCDMGGGSGVSASTVRRWVLEVIGELAARAPRLDRVLATVKRDGGEVVLLDGTLVPTRRRTGKQNRRNYSGKHKRHGLQFLVMTDLRGNLLWISAAKPGRTHDGTATKHNRIPAKLRNHGLAVVGDLNFSHVDDDKQDPVVLTGRRPHPKRPLTEAEKEVNSWISRDRAANEHGIGDLKNWRILTKLRMHADRATTLLRALMLLTQSEITR